MKVYYDDNGKLKKIKQIQYGNTILELIPTIDGNLIIRKKKLKYEMV